MKTMTTITASMTIILPASVLAQATAKKGFAGHVVSFTISGDVVAAPSSLGGGQSSVLSQAHFQSLADRNDGPAKHQGYRGSK